MLRLVTQDSYNLLTGVLQASRLAIAGHSVLLIESGDDQGGNANYTIPGYQAAVTHQVRKH
jgi:phytoene dehydrogenase-like protein